MRSRKKSLVTLTLLGVLSIALTSAAEQTPGSGDFLRRLEAVEAELGRTRQNDEVQSETPHQTPSSTAGPDYGIDLISNGYPTCDVEQKYPSVTVHGFFHLDAGYYSQDTMSIATLGDIDDGLGFRRARLSASGSVADGTTYMMEYDFAQAQARFTDVWMQFVDMPLGQLRIGRYRQPFGMAELTSVKELPFLERPLTFALAPFRQTGVMLSDTALDQHMTWAASGYRYISDNFGNVYADAGGYGLATRVTFLPFDCGDDQLVHFGVDYSFNNPGRDVVGFASTNEFFVGQNPNLGAAGLSVLPITGVPAFVSTGQIPTAHTNLFNVEAAASFGSLLVQSEARWAQLEHLDKSTGVFPGAYLVIRYVLTGETIPYNRQTGVFGGIKPYHSVNLCCGDWGAWEIAARVSYLDLNGDGLPGPGRRLVDTTLGMNWYVNDFTRFQCNWIHAILDDPTLGESDTDALAVRGQINF